MPSIGGLAIFLAFLLGYMLFAPKTTQMLSVLIGGFVIVLVGIIDDIKPPSTTSQTYWSDCCSVYSCILW